MVTISCACGETHFEVKRWLFNFHSCTRHPISFYTILLSAWANYVKLGAEEMKSKFVHDFQNFKILSN